MNITELTVHELKEKLEKKRAYKLWNYKGIYR